MKRLSGKVAIITGGASGIGESIARMFVKEGARVCLADIQDDLGVYVSTDIGDSSTYLRADITQAAEVIALVEATLKQFGRIDVLVNNAGIVTNGVPIASHSEEDFDSSIAVNLKGAWLCMKYIFPIMSKNGMGSIINIASISAIIGTVGQSAYGASKGGLLQLTRHCAAEGAEVGIRVNCISPGEIVTPMSFAVSPGVPKEIVIKRIADRSMLGRAGWPDDVAYAATWLASEEARYVTAQNIVIDGGVTGIRRKVSDSPTESRLELN